jgi:hypothetical protein
LAVLLHPLPEQLDEVESQLPPRLTLQRHGATDVLFRLQDYKITKMTGVSQLRLTLPVL